MSSEVKCEIPLALVEPPARPAVADGGVAPSTTGRRTLPVLLAALSAIGPFSIDAYLPSFREIALQLGASQVQVQHTLTAYLVSFAVMTLWHGVLSDAYGRRRVTLVLLATFAAASVGCVFAWSIEALIGFRALQGMSAGAGVIIGRAIVRDLYDGADARRVMSSIAAVFAIAPALAPIVGGWLQVFFGWRAVFVFLALFAAALWLACYKLLAESLPTTSRRPFKAGPVLQGYMSAMTSGPFLALIAALAFNFSAVFVYISSAPTFLLDVLHQSETDFLWLFGPITAGLVLGTQVAARVASRWSNARTIAVAYSVMAVAVIGNIAFHYLHTPALPWSMLPLIAYVFGTALAAPSLTLMALDLMPRNRGLASSCQGFLQTSGNLFAAGVIAPLFWSGALDLAFGMGILFIAAIAAYALYLAQRQAIGPGYTAS